MDRKVLSQLARIIRTERDSLLARWRAQVRELPSAQHLDIPTLNNHIPKLLEEIALALECPTNETIPEALAEQSPPEHGLQRFEVGFDIVEVVAEYNVLRESIHDLAQEHGLGLEGEPFRILNRVLDSAIGTAVQTFATQQALEVQNRREEYLAFVAHDLRTPLNAIALASDALQAVSWEQRGGGTKNRLLYTLRRNVQQLTSLVDKVLKENMHLDAHDALILQCRTFQLWPLVEDLLRTLEPVADSAATQLTNAIPEDLEVWADAGLLRRVFQNLIANAIKYSPRGEIKIGAHLATDRNEPVLCWVDDNGAGIPPELVEKVFEKFTTDADGSDGIGLGLAIVQSIIAAHGGRVEVNSQEGVGTTFRFTLPGKPSGVADI